MKLVKHKERIAEQKQTANLKNVILHDISDYADFVEVASTARHTCA